MKVTDRDHMSLINSKVFHIEDFGHHFNPKDFINKSFDHGHAVSQGSSIQ